MRFLFLLSALLMYEALDAQKVMSFAQISRENIRVSWLDSNYVSAVHTDTALAVFKTENAQQKFSAAYTAFIQKLAAFLTANGFEFKQEQRCFNRVYFDANGKAEYFIYSFSNKGIEPQNQVAGERLTEFERLVTLFLQQEKIAVHSPVPFAQCSPVVYGRK
ncbi:MAG: hypothetical protein IM638_02965 [Bacteroidetes bacterium]|nr:hypothetical protein [Bacteroidota bacterium]